MEFLKKKPFKKPLKTPPSRTLKAIVMDGTLHTVGRRPLLYLLALVSALPYLCTYSSFGHSVPLVALVGVTALCVGSR
jgi:hypothetical protein